jgi:hypothetical protein
MGDGPQGKLEGKQRGVYLNNFHDMCGAANMSISGVSSNGGGYLQHPKDRKSRQPPAERDANAPVFAWHTQQASSLTDNDAAPDSPARPVLGSIGRGSIA